MVKLFIATPAYDGKVFVPYALSLSTTVRELAEAGINIHICIKTSGSLLVSERNSLVEAFVRSDCTHMLCIDSDIGWEPKIVKKLIDKDEDFVGGVYPSRVKNQFVFRPKFNADGFLYKNEKDLIEMEYIPAGFMLLTQNVFKVMREKYPELYFEPKHKDEDSKKGYAFFNTELWEGEFWGEDYIFCKRARDAGIRIWVDPFLKFDHSGNKGSLSDVMQAEDVPT
jgi:hypothetical protein